MFISLPDKECVVIQIFHTDDATLPQTAIDKNRCGVPLGAEKDIVPGGRITYTILGSLRNYVTKGQYEDTVFFDGIADRFCFTHEDLDEIRCEKDLDTPILHPNRDEYDAIQLGSGSGSGLGQDRFSENGSFNALRFDKIQDIFVFTLTKTPTHTKSLMLMTTFYIHTRSWIDVIIQNTEVFNRKVQYPSETIPLFRKEYSPTRVRSTVSNVLLLRLVRKTSKVKTDLKLLIHCYFVIEFNGVVTTWDSVMTVWGTSFEKVISLAGRIVQVTFHFHRGQSRLQTINNYALKATCIYGIYDRYSSFSQMEPTPCFHRTMFGRDLVHCYNFFPPITESIGKVVYTVFIREFGYGRDGDWREDDLFNWNKASWLCGRTGGSLPYFTSREMLEELVALLKMSTYFYQFEGIFIGLHTKAENRVLIPLLHKIKIISSCIDQMNC